MEIIKKLEKIFIDTLDLEEIELTRQTSADDVEEWDSLNHIMLIVAIENEFNLRFTSKEIQDWKDVGEMIDCIESKKA